jgi:death on curing protein
MEKCEPKWLDDRAILALHRRHLAEHGGAEGIRDENLLESALLRPRQRWHYEPHSSISALAAAYCYGLARNHPFVDDNKRTSTVALLLFLALNGYKLRYTEDELYDLILAVASGKMEEEQLTAWLEPRMQLQAH